MTKPLTLDSFPILNAYDKPTGRLGFKGTNTYMNARLSARPYHRLHVDGDLENGLPFQLEGIQPPYQPGSTVPYTQEHLNAQICFDPQDSTLKASVPEDFAGSYKGALLCSVSTENSTWDIECVSGLHNKNDNWVFPLYSPDMGGWVVGGHSKLIGIGSTGKIVGEVDFTPLINDTSLEEYIRASSWIDAYACPIGFSQGAVYVLIGASIVKVSMSWQSLGSIEWMTDMIEAPAQWYMKRRATGWQDGNYFRIFGYGRHPTLPDAGRLKLNIATGEVVADSYTTNSGGTGYYGKWIAYKVNGAYYRFGGITSKYASLDDIQYYNTATGSLTSGTPLWENNVNYDIILSGDSTQVQGIVGVYQGVFLCHAGNTISGIDDSTGATIWSHDFGATYGANWYSGGYSFLSSDGFVHAFFHESTNSNFTSFRYKTRKDAFYKIWYLTGTFQILEENENVIEYRSAGDGGWALPLTGIAPIGVHSVGVHTFFVIPVGYADTSVDFDVTPDSVIYLYEQPTLVLSQGSGNKIKLTYDFRFEYKMPKALGQTGNWPHNLPYSITTGIIGVSSITGTIIQGHFEGEYEFEIQNMHDVTARFSPNWNTQLTLFDADVWPQLLIQNPQQYWNTFTSPVAASIAGRKMQINGKWYHEIKLGGLPDYENLQHVGYPGPRQVVFECQEYPEFSVPFQKAKTIYVPIVDSTVNATWRLMVKCRAGTPQEFFTPYSSWLFVDSTSWKYV